MTNLPKLASAFQDLEATHQIHEHQIDNSDDAKLRKIATANQNRSLSPFTWNNIKLPSVLIKSKPTPLNKTRQKDSNNLILPKETSSTIDAVDDIKLQTIDQKAKKALKNIIQMKKGLPQKSSPLKFLHDQVVKQSEKRKLPTGLKKGKNRLTTLEQAQYLSLKEIDKGLSFPAEQSSPQDNLKKTSQRYRNIKSKYSDEGNKTLVTGHFNRFHNPSSKNNSSTKGRLKGQADKKSNERSSITDFQNSIIVKQSRNFSKHRPELLLNEEMQPYIRNYFIELAQSPDLNKYKIFVTTNPKYQPLHLNQYNSSAFGNDNQHKTLIWTKTESLHVFRQKSENQFYNHLEGSHFLTSKEKLHEIINKNKHQNTFYPLSFALPKEYNQFIEQYDWTLVKNCLKLLIVLIQDFEKEIRINEQSPDYNFSVCLSDVLDDLTRDTKNEQQLRIVKFCLFLQSGRKKQKLNFLFQKIKTYREVEVILSAHVYIGIIQWCLDLMRLHHESQVQESNSSNLKKQVGLQNIDYRLIELLKAFDYLLGSYLPSYLYKNLSFGENSWVIKPYASSKAAGISMILNNTDFYTTQDYEYKEYKFRSKFHNKIFMKYIENPLLIKHSGIDFFTQKIFKQTFKSFEKKQNQPEEILQKITEEVNLKVQRFLKLEEKYSVKKFDIRQWFIIVCEEEEHQEGRIDQNAATFSNKMFMDRKSPRQKVQKKFIVYKYHTAYCRFSQKQYSLNNPDLQVHLTNYSLYKKSLQKNPKQLIGKDKSLSSPRQEKKQWGNNLQVEQKNLQNDSDERLKNKNKNERLAKGSSLLMLDDLFQYLDFVSKIKQKKFRLDLSSLNQVSFAKNCYDNQLNKILTSLFEAAVPHLVYHSKTFELFGLDLLFDQSMNLYLLEVNLNPGCSSSRDQKLQKEAKMMLSTMFKTVMKFQDQKTKLTHSQFNKKNQSQGNKQETLLQQSNYSPNSNLNTLNLELKGDKNKLIKQKQDKWILVCENSVS